MLRTTIGRLAIQSGLPPELRDFTEVLDKKGVEALLKRAAALGPDEYRSVAQHLLQVGKMAAQLTGGNSFGPEHLKGSIAGRKAQTELGQQIRGFYADKRLSKEEKEKKTIDLLIGAGDKLTDDVMREAVSSHNPLAMQIISGSRGNPTNLRSLLAGDLLYVDHRDRPIPIPVLHSYSQGLSPAEFFAGAFGARKGIISAKLSTADTGSYLKQMRQAAHRLVVTAQDHEEEPNPDEPRGLPVPIDDPHNEGCALAIPVGPYNRNDILTPRILADLKSRGVERLLLRSPTVGGPEDGGLYAKDLGIREKGTLPPVGDFVGISSADALGEPTLQAALGVKHSGGVAKGHKAAGPVGFQLFDQYLQEPKTFKGGAAHAQEDGRVSSVRPAPQGGTYVVIAGKDHYIGRGYAPLVKVGQEIEAGDAISEGIPIPAEIVKHKGIGEGRRYFVGAFTRAYQAAGVPVDRRNVEVLARALIDHVEIQNELDDHLPGDVVSYSRLEHSYRPRPDHVVVPIAQARNRYLEKPVLHYSIGTPMRPSVLRTLADFGVKQVAVHAEPPAFTPRMIRGMENLSHDPDWLTKFLGAYLKKGLLTSAHRGAVSDERGTSFVPSLARAENFGKLPPVKGWEPAGALPKAPAPSASILAQMAPEKIAALTMPFVKSDDDYEVPAPEEDEDEISEPTGTNLQQYHSLCHCDETGEPLTVIQGSDPKGKSGSFLVFRHDRLRKRTRFFRNCTEEELDRLLRAVAPWLAEAPKSHCRDDALAAAIDKFAARG